MKQNNITEKKTDSDDLRLLNPNIAQRQAANPSASVWVAASAGSGKTRVLSNRVLNLLLGGTEASKILCLTFTKAAAAEMENRIAARLSSWVSLSDKELTEEIENLGGYPADETVKKRARQLFARMLDAKGGMKIMTIHSFCQTLLKRFPTEAGVLPNFKGVDEADAKGLLSSVVEKCLNAGDLRGQIDVLSLYMSEDDISSSLLGMDKDRAKLANTLAYYGSVENICDEIYRRFDVDKDDTEESVMLRISDIPDEERVRFLAQRLAEGGKIGQTASEKIFSFLNTDKKDRGKKVYDYISAFITKTTGELAQKVVVNAQKDELMPIFSAEGERIKQLLETKKRIKLIHAAIAFLRLAFAVFAQYSKEKDLRGWLDFTDLILKAKNLLQKGTPWVLYKLDGGISHILVDEAQDTNSEQWDIINALTDEFFAGEGASDEKRTVFAVGDKKQSIFSFQGANPDKFNANKEHFTAALSALGDKLQIIPLQVSFRSSQAVLNLVNIVLANPSASCGVIDEGEDCRHISYRRGQAGRVEIWPLETIEESDEEDAFLPPIDNRPRQSAQDRLAAKIANKIKYMLEKDKLESENRRIIPSDIMILVYHRGSFFEKMVRALKELQIPVTGVDRMLISEQLACMDLIALGNFLCLPEDDLNLACLLKSPLCGFTEEELFAIAAKRGNKSLWNSLVAKAEEEGMSDSKYALTVKYLQDLQDKADWMLPSALYGLVLGAKGGKRALLQRLGYDAEDAVDEFFNLVLDFEKSNTPSLQGFLLWLKQRNIEVKRDLEQGGLNAVRITTVHSSKGLEAPIVFIPDTITLPKMKEKLFWLGNDNFGIPFWTPKTGLVSGEAQKAKDIMKAKQMAEYKRLLYVALTRPRDRLYIAGWENKRIKTAKNKQAQEYWYNLIISSLPDEYKSHIGKDGSIIITNPQEADCEKGRVLTEKKATELPLWTKEPPAAEPMPPKPLSPSRFAEAEEVPSYPSPMDSVRQKAVEKGNIIHKLLEMLPDIKQDMRQEKAVNYLQKRAKDFTETERKDILQKVFNILQDSRFKDFFGEQSKAEASVIGMVNGKAFSGKIDRLAVLDKEVVVIDYKTGKYTNVDNIQPAYKEQMRIYKQLLQQVFPDKQIKTFLLWTETASFTEV